MSQEPILSPGSAPRISYAPNHEDILLDRIFGDHVGTFMDVGPRGPTVDSLTYFFYRRGWRGVNLAPGPRRHAQLQAARPGDLNLPLAAWDTNGEIPCFEVATPVGDDLSTFSARRAEQYRTRGAPIIERRVPVRSIRSLVEELELDPPDFLAIGAEGFEEAVIRGIPLEHWRPGILIVESTGPDAEAAVDAHEGWEPVLLEHGYLFATFNGVNRFYLRDDLRDRRSHLERPVSVRDRFQRAEVVALHERVHSLEHESIGWRDDAARWREQCDQLRQRQEDAALAPFDPRAEAERRALEVRLAQAEMGCDFWQGQCEALRRELHATQRTLRPYRLIDQLGVVPIGYRWARRLKPNRAS